MSESKIITAQQGHELYSCKMAWRVEEALEEA
jgi:hypothetical protein